MIAVADTGFVIAVLNRRDHYHQKASNVYQQAETIHLPQTTLTLRLFYVAARRIMTSSVFKQMFKFHVCKGH